MHLRTFKATTMAEALRQVKSELGTEARAFQRMRELLLRAREVLEDVRHLGDQLLEVEDGLAREYLATSARSERVVVARIGDLEEPVAQPGFVLEIVRALPEDLRKPWAVETHARMLEPDRQLGLARQLVEYLPALVVHVLAQEAEDAAGAGFHEGSWA